MIKFVIIAVLVVLVIVLLFVIRGNKRSYDSLDRKHASTNARDLRKYHDSNAGREMANRRWHNK